MTTALDPHVPIPLAPRAPIHDQLQRERAGREGVAYVRTRMRWCDTCGAHGDQPCRTRGGNDARQWHRGRG